MSLERAMTVAGCLSVALAALDAEPVPSSPLPGAARSDIRSAILFGHCPCARSLNVGDNRNPSARHRPP